MLRRSSTYVLNVQAITYSASWGSEGQFNTCNFSLKALEQDGVNSIPSLRARED
jgi:hypothetical protein